jgi:tRNA (guanine37-N1)-methyltransferase
MIPRRTLSIMGLIWMLQLQASHRTAAWVFRAGSKRSHSVTFQTLQTTRWMSSTSNLGDTQQSSSPSSSLNQDQRDLLENWRDHPSVNPTLVFPTLLIPSESLQRWIQEPQLQAYLAKPANWDLLQHVHPRIKMVQEYNDTHKLVLLRSDETLPSDVLQDDSIEMGPEKHIELTFRQLSFGYILSQLLPVPAPSAYEQIGHVAHFNLKPHHLPYGKLVGQVLRETNPTIETVVSKVGEVKGKYRTYDLEVLAGPPKFDTTVVEHGVQIQLNVADCYWCTRLSGERQELLADIEKNAPKDLVVADIFSGVGAVCLLLAKNKPDCTILANDWNPKAIQYMKQSIERNGLNPSKFQLTCGDTYNFLMDLGNDEIPDHVLMNYPLEAPTFLGALRWWPWKRFVQRFEQVQRHPRFHVYTFARSEKDANDEEEVAVDIIANELLPSIDMKGGDESSSSRPHRRDELNEEFYAQVQTRLVRDVAPGKVVVCVSFSLTPKLVRYMQGDYF